MHEKGCLVCDQTLVFVIYNQLIFHAQHIDQNNNIAVITFNTLQ